ncbi:MAG: isopentenyl-diphosphate Delta-isomerase [Bacteroidota bacterium]
MINEDFLILVNEKDQPWGKLEKSLVHQLGILHRAFSVFVFNSQGELLLQQRADDKYHSGGLWTNSCCSHPRYGEELAHAVERRLMEEMGINCATNFEFGFVYKAEFENGLKEHEYDHVFFGVCDLTPCPDESEVKNWKYIDMYALEAELKNNPQKYTAWLRICFDKVLLHYREFVVKSNLKIKENVSI